MVEIFRSVVNVVSALAIPLFILVFLGWGFVKKVKVYEVFVEGAKDGFTTAVKIIPFLVAMLFGIGIFRASGAMDFVVGLLSPLTNLIGMPADVLPLGLLRPLSGSGSMGLMTELMKTHGPDSFIGVLASTMYGSSETTFYILAVYFGSVGIKNTRHALPAGLIADFAGMLGAVFIVRILFGV
ncbi:MAG: spore maturation protein [Bacteroidota bacterium]|jgi:spore maturation protein B